MKLTVLIVDDEAYVRDGIERTMPWEKMGIGQIYQARNGREGMDVSKRVKPDLVISDVRMPQMDGLAMISAMREAQIDARVIFMSAYSELDYYRRAMKLHAVSFVEKPIVLEELENEISHAVQMIAAERTNAKLSEEELTRFALLGLLHRNDTPSVNQLRATIATDEQLTLVMIGRAGMMTDSCEHELGRLLADRLSLRAWTADDGDVRVILLTGRILKERQLQQIGNILLSELHEQPVYITIGVCHESNEIADCYQQVRERQTYAFFHQEAHFDVTLISGKKSAAVAPSDEQFLSRIREAVTQEDYARLDAVVREALQCCAACSPNQARSFMLDILDAVKNAFGALGVKSAVDVTWETVVSKTSFVQLQELCRDYIRTLANYAEELHSKGRSFYWIRKEIEQHYRQPGFSIAALAERLHFSESYLGNTFKKHYHMSIGTYINQLRMEEAKRRLLEPNARVSEVAAEVGFDSTDYFTKRFRQYTGQTPTEYRR